MVNSDFKYLHGIFGIDIDPRDLPQFHPYNGIRANMRFSYNRVGVTELKLVMGHYLLWQAAPVSGHFRSPAPEGRLFNIYCPPSEIPEPGQNVLGWICAHLDPPLPSLK